MEMTINKLIEFCEEEEYTHRIRCKQYDAASGFTRTGNKDIRTACAFSEEIKSNHYQQMIDIMRKYQKITEIVKAWNDMNSFDSMVQIREVLEDDCDDGESEET
jgi:ribonucleotide reductase beta subunit family protein with ferritin-like domain